MVITEPQKKLMLEEKETFGEEPPDKSKLGEKEVNLEKCLLRF